MSFINNLFGTIAGQTNITPPWVGFIPTDKEYGTLDIKSNAVWIGLKDRENQRLAYESCYPVASVVDKLAQLDTNGIVEILKLKGKGKDDYAKGEWADRMNRLFTHPNPLQSWDQFRGQQVVYKKIYGFCPVLPVIPVGLSYAVTMINLPPYLFSVERTGSLYGTKIEDHIKRYYLTLNGEKIPLDPSQVIILADGFILDDNLLPQSKLVGLDMAVSNICAAMEADNVLLKKRGPLGFISHDAAATKDSVAGYIPMQEREKKELQDALQQYGLSLSQYQYVISRTATKWNPMSFDVNQLGTKATVIAGAEAICQRYGFPYILFKESDSTFANGNQASKNVYQNEVIPSNKKDMAMYDKFFMAEENNATITCDFEWLPILQEDELQKANAAKAWNDALLIEYKNGLITKNQWLSQRGYDTIPDGDKYYNDDIQGEKGTVQGEDSGTEGTAEPEG
jgi:hypothetical protein